MTVKFYFIGMPNVYTIGETVGDNVEVYWYDDDGTRKRTGYSLERVRYNLSVGTWIPYTKYLRKCKLEKLKEYE